MATKKSVAKATKKVQGVEHEEIKKGKKALAKKVKAKKEPSGPPKMTPDEEAALTRILAMLETGFLAVAADGVIDEAEFNNLGGNFAGWLEQDVPVDAMVELINDFAGALHEQGFGGRLEYLASALDKDGRLAAFRFASVMAACDGDVNDEELGVLGEIAEAFEISEKAANKEFKEIYDQVMELVD